MLTQHDIEEIERIVTQIIDERTKHLPTKDDFFSKMDQLSKEIRDARDELTIHSGSHDTLNDKTDELDARLAKVEKKLQLAATAA